MDAHTKVKEAVFPFVFDGLCLGNVGGLGVSDSEKGLPISGGLFLSLALGTYVCGMKKNLRL